MIHRTCFWSLLGVLAIPAPAFPQSAAETADAQARRPDRAEARKEAAPPPAQRSANDPELKLPPLPEGVADLCLNEIFKRPFGRRGLEYSEKAKSLEGRRVRIPGYMVRRCSHVPGQFLFTAQPVTLHDHEMGPCDDLPPETVFVSVPGTTPRMALAHVVVHVPGLILPTGTLRLGGRPEPDGRISWVRLELDPPPPEPKADESSAREDGGFEGPLPSAATDRRAAPDASPAGEPRREEAAAAAPSRSAPPAAAEETTDETPATRTNGGER